MALEDLEIGDAEGFGIVENIGEAIASGFDGEGGAARVGAHPFDRDGAAACADVPEVLAGEGGEGVEGESADFLFGELAVVVVDRVWN